MKSLRLFALSSIMVFLLAGGVSSQEQGPGSGVIAFTGYWVLDKGASDDISKLISRPQNRSQGSMGGSHDGGRGGGMRGGGMRGGGMRGGGRMGGGGGKGQGQQRPGGSPTADSAQKKLRMQKQIANLNIFSDGNELDITDGLDMTRLLYCDGRQVNIWTERGETKARAKWQNGKLVETWSGKKSPRRTMTYTLSDDGTRLVVLDKRLRPGQEGGVTLRLVYDRQVESP